MTFRIHYDKTGDEIEIDDKRAYLMLTFKELESLGFKAADVWEE